MGYPNLPGSPDPDGGSIPSPTAQLSWLLEEMSWQARIAFNRTSRNGIDWLVILGE